MRDLIRQAIERSKPLFEAAADALWDAPETAYREVQASAYQKEFLRRHGFQVEEKLGGIDTAFCAVWGSGTPVLAFLGEFDALPGLSQQAGVFTPAPVAPGAPGHGCGHHLLGTALMEAACALKKYMSFHHLPGVIAYYGCPAEETGAGKVFLVRAGCFEKVDFAFSWHPYAASGIVEHTLANVRLRLAFQGKSAHASASPWLGRSALNACELTNIGVNYLREEIRPECRIHHTFLDAGGRSTNSIPAAASLLYTLRASENEAVRQLTQRVLENAGGAALMTDTTLEARIVSGYSSMLSLPAFDDVLRKNMVSLLPEAEAILPAGEDFFHASTDVGDVSRTLPTVLMALTCFSPGTALHSLEATAQGKSVQARGGMHRAAQILSETAADLLEDSSLRLSIRQEFEQSSKVMPYVPLIPTETVWQDVLEIL